MKKQLIIIVVLALIGVAIYAFSTSQLVSQDLLGRDPKLYLYTINRESTGQLNVSIPFTEASDDDYVVEIAVDVNQDGQIGEDEWQIKDTRAYLVQNLRNNYWIVDDAKKLAVSNEVLLKINLKKPMSPDSLESFEGKAEIES